MKRWGATALTYMVLTGCGNAGPAVPAQATGAWGVDCSEPFVTFGSGVVMSAPTRRTIR